MFQITILSLHLGHSLIQTHNLKIRASSSSKIEYETGLCSGKSFQWNEKFPCPEDEKIIQFEVLSYISQSRKERIATGIYDFVNRAEELVTSNERQVKLFNDGHFIGTLHILVEYVETAPLARPGMTPTSLTFGYKNNSARMNSTTKKSEGNLADFSTAHKTQNGFPTAPPLMHLQSFGIKIRESRIVQQKEKELLITTPPMGDEGGTKLVPQTYSTHQNTASIYLSKIQDKKRNLFSCLDNWNQEWELAPHTLRRTQTQ